MSTPEPVANASDTASEQEPEAPQVRWLSLSPVERDRLAEIAAQLRLETRLIYAEALEELVRRYDRTGQT